MSTLCTGMHFQTFMISEIMASGANQQQLEAEVRICCVIQVMFTIMTMLTVMMMTMLIIVIDDIRVFFYFLLKEMRNVFISK